MARLNNNGWCQREARVWQVILLSKSLILSHILSLKEDHLPRSFHLYSYKEHTYFGFRWNEFSSNAYYDNPCWFPLASSCLAVDGGAIEREERRWIGQSSLVWGGEGLR